jgi:hypothetical protein
VQGPGSEPLPPGDSWASVLLPSGPWPHPSAACLLVLLLPSTSLGKAFLPYCWTMHGHNVHILRHLVLGFFLLMVVSWPCWRNGIDFYTF